MTSPRFEQLIQKALAQDFSGWDFSWTEGRWQEDNPSWNYRKLVQTKIRSANSLMDMGTGGGEFLASLPDLPKRTSATESYPPNIPIARARLEPIGVNVIAVESNGAIPVPDQSLQLIINRHESYCAAELYRLLRSGGSFLTQQVGRENNIQLNEFLRAPKEADPHVHRLEDEIQKFERSGFQILRAEEEFLDSIFDDIGVAVFYLRIISWQIPDFSVDKYLDRLLAMHELIERHGAFQSKAHRILIEAKKTG